jgi:hypothetical protein
VPVLYALRKQDLGAPAQRLPRDADPAFRPTS